MAVIKRTLTLLRSHFTASRTEEVIRKRFSTDYCSNLKANPNQWPLGMHTNYFMAFFGLGLPLINLWCMRMSVVSGPFADACRTFFAFAHFNYIPLPHQFCSNKKKT